MDESRSKEGPFLEALKSPKGPFINGYGPELMFSERDREPGLWYYQALEPPWLACQRVVVREGRPVVAELRVIAVSERFGQLADKDLPPEGLTNRVSRTIKTRGHLEAADQLAGSELGSSNLFGVYFGEDFGSRFTKTAARTKSMDADFARLAARYVDKVLGGSRRPVQELATELGLDTPRVRDLIHEARRRDLLTRMPRGQAGGVLTQKAKNLLRIKPEEGNSE